MAYEKITGDQGYKQLKRTGKTDLFMDLTEAVFHFDNDPATSVEQRVPILYEKCTGLVSKGGEVKGNVKIGEFYSTYKDGSAIRILNCPAFVVDGFRSDKTWDGIRLRINCDGAVIKNSYISNTRDDLIENDYQHAITVENCLLENGLSVMGCQPPSSAPAGTNGNGKTIVLRNVVASLTLYNQEGRMTHGAPFKCSTYSTDTNPFFELYDTIIAISDPKHNGLSRHKRFCKKAKGFGKCYWLNLSDKLLAKDYPIPSGFTLLQGKEAREFFEKSKIEWLNNNPQFS